MDHHVPEQTARDLDIGHRRRGRVEGGNGEKLRLADLPRIQRRLHRSEVGIEAAVEPNHHRLAVARDVSLTGARAFKAEVHRLFAKHRLARSRCGLDQVGMGIGRRGDQHSVNLAFGDDLLRCANGTAILRRQSLGIGRDMIRNGNKRAGRMTRDGGGVNARNPPCTQ